MSPPSAAVAIPSKLSSVAIADETSQSSGSGSGSTEKAGAAAKKLMSSGTTILLALLAVYVVWGSTYLAMRIAVETLPPMLMGAARFTTAGAILLLLGRRTAGRWPTAAEWRAAAPVGALLFVGGNGLVAIGETEVSSGIAAVVVATMPLWMAIFSSVLGDRPRAREWLGIAIGFGGVIVLISGAELSAEPTAALVLALSPFCWALGSTIARRVPQAPGLLAGATQQIAGGLAMIAAGLIHGERVPTHPSANSLWALAYLVVFGSLLAFTAYAWLLRNTRPAVATSYAFVNPPVAVLLGAVFYAEPVGAATWIATPIIVAAVVLVIGRPRPPR